MYKRGGKPMVVEPGHLILKIKNQTYLEESNKNVHLFGGGGVNERTGDIQTRKGKRGFCTLSSNIGKAILSENENKLLWVFPEERPRDNEQKLEGVRWENSLMF